MSSTGRSDVRVTHDVYPTPSWCVHRLLEAVPLPGGLWLEPAAGDGAIIRAVCELREDISWRALEIRPSCHEFLQVLTDDVVIADSLGLPWKRKEPRVIMTNPPYLLAEAFLAKALRTEAVVVLLLRLDFLGSDRRAKLFHRTPPDVHVLPNRPSFVNGKTDSNEYGWFVWDGPRERPHGHVRVLASTPREVRCPKRPREPGELLLA